MALSRRTFVEGKRYETLVFQENTHPGDFEMVELQDIQNREREALAQNLITDGFLADSFKVVGTSLSNAVVVTAGPGGYSEGRRLLLPDLNHPLTSNQYIYNMAIATPAVARTDLVYLDVFIDDVDATVDPDIEDPMLGPSAYRERVDYQFAVSQNVSAVAIPILPVGHVGLPLALVTRRAADPSINVADVVDVRPMAAINPQFKAKNTLVVSPYGGDFNDPGQAVTSLDGISSASSPWTILVMPGVYTTYGTINIVSPYITLMGTDPKACFIKVDLSNSGTTSAVAVGADQVAIKNLSIDVTANSGGTGAVVFCGGSYNLSIENVVMGSDSFANANATGGVYFNSGAVVDMRHCTISGQLSSTSALVYIGPNCVVSIEDCVAFAAGSDMLNVQNSAAVTIRASNFTGTNCLIISSGAMTAYDSTWTSAVVNGVAVVATVPITGPYSMTLQSGVSNTLTNCAINAAGGVSSVVGTSMIWTRVNADTQIYYSGGGSSVFRQVQFLGGLYASGVSPQSEGCKFYSPVVQIWNAAGLTIDQYTAVLIDGGASPVFIGCEFRPNTSTGVSIRSVSGGAPVFDSCGFYSYSTGVTLFYVLSTSTNILVRGCRFVLTAAYGGATPVIVGASGGSGRFTFVQNHLEGSALGQPAYVLWGIATGCAVFAGANTSTATSGLHDPTTITSFTNIAQAT